MRCGFLGLHWRHRVRTTPCGKSGSGTHAIARCEEVRRSVCCNAGKQVSFFNVRTAALTERRRLTLPSKHALLRRFGSTHCSRKPLRGVVSNDWFVFIGGWHVFLFVTLPKRNDCMPTYESLPSPSEFFKGKLYQRMVDDLRHAGLVKRTVYGYVRAVRNWRNSIRKCPIESQSERCGAICCT